MSKKRQIYIHDNLPGSLSSLLSNSEVLFVKNPMEVESSLFKIGGEKSNVFFNPINWTKINSSPIGFLNNNLFDWDIPKLVLKRFFAGEGALGPEENYKGVLQKSGTLKILESNSLGYYSDIITSFASEVKINPTQVRNFSIMILGFLDYLNRQDLVSLPIEVDYGISQDCFFLQIHCDKGELFLENFLESTDNLSVKDPFTSLLKEACFKTDLLEIYTLNSNSKLVLNACWIHNPNFVRKDFFPSLIIHQVKHLNVKDKKLGSATIPKTFFDTDLRDLRKSKIVEKLPTKNVDKDIVGELKEVINPILVKRMFTFIQDKHFNNGFSVSESGYDLTALENDIIDFPDKKALARLNRSEREELVKIILENAPEILSQVEEVKSQIDSDDYLDSILNSLNQMTLEEVAHVLGATEDLGEENTMVKGSKEDLTEDITKVGGSIEEDEMLTHISGSQEKEEKNWELKRSNVAKKVRGIINDRRLQNATHEEIDVEVKEILKSEFNLSEDKSELMVMSISDSATDEWVSGGLDAVNQSIKQRIKIEKMENQLGLREKQVKKMKELIINLKNELAGLRSELTTKKRSILSNPEAISIGTEIPRSEGISDSQQKIINTQAEKINELKEVNSQTVEEIERIESDHKNLLNNLKAKSAESEREIQKLKNEVHDLGEENRILQKKVREGMEEVAEIRDTNVDVSSVLEENENLKAQVESLKKRMSFMYENSKSNKEISIGANEVQKIIDDKERFFEDKVKQAKEIDSLRADLRESERVIKQKELEIIEKSDLLKGKAVGADEDEVVKMKKEVLDSKQEVNKLQIELKAAQIKTKSFEQKVKFMTAQLDKYTAVSKKVGGTGAMGSVDPKLAGKLKQSETMNRRLKEAGEKIQKELVEKKADLHKLKMENKAQELQIKDLERKLALASGKKNAA